MAVLDSTTPTAGSVTAAVRNYLQRAGVSGAAASIVIDPAEPTTAGYGDPVTVTVQIPFTSVSWLPSPMFLRENVNLKASTVMRRETVQ